jgi:hypothetical protein
MLAVKEKESLFKVECWEHESGYKPRFMGEKYFGTEAEAKKYCENYYYGDSDCFFRANYTKVA